MNRGLNFGQMSTRQKSCLSRRGYVKVNLSFGTKRFVNTKEKRPIGAPFNESYKRLFFFETKQKAVVENRHIFHVFTELIRLEVVLLQLENLPIHIHQAKDF